MTVGRSDAVLRAPTGVPIGDVILRVCHRHWPNGVFQDADSDDCHALSDPWVWWIGVTSREFFVFKSAQLAQTWDETGPVPENYNDFLHFLVRRYRDEPGSEFEFTIVYDELNDWMRGFLDELQEGLFEALKRANEFVPWELAA